MRILFFLVALSISLSLLNPLDSVAGIFKKGNHLFSEYVFEAVSEVDCRSEANHVIYGNYSDFDSSLLYSLIHDEDKICIFYDLDLSDNVNNNYEIMQNNAVVYYYKNNIPHIFSYISSSTEEEHLINDIENYVNEILLKIDNEDLFYPTPTAFLQSSLYTTENEVFEPLYAGSFRKEETPYGHIDCDYVVKKCVSSDVSNLYITQATFSFTPGKMAKNSENTGYANWYNSTGYVKIKAAGVESEIGIDQALNGGTAVFKGAYPIISPQNAPITSSSYRPYQLPIYSLSTQKDPKDTEKYTWLYTCAYPQSDVYRLDVGYMFEMNNIGYDMLACDIALTFEYEMTVYNNNWWVLFNKNHTFSGSTFHNHY